MNELKQAVFSLLRSGKSVMEIRRMLADLEAELNNAGHYIEAIKDADFRP